MNMKPLVILDENKVIFSKNNYFKINSSEMGVANREEIINIKITFFLIHYKSFAF